MGSSQFSSRDYLNLLFRIRLCLHRRTNETVFSIIAQSAVLQKRFTCLNDSSDIMCCLRAKAFEVGGYASVNSSSAHPPGH